MLQLIPKKFQMKRKKPNNNNNNKQTSKSQNKQYFDRAKYGHDLDEIWNKKH